MDVEPGDKVKVVCSDRSRIDNDPSATKSFIGIVRSTFNAFDKKGDNWYYEIVSKQSGWFLYKPRIDGGTITVLEKGHQPRQ